jgi:LytS/YehU family sensor histidine kinase
MSFPPLLLQPLVENAVRHGIEPAISGGRIQVEVRRVDDCLEATVRDTGVGMNVQSPPGVGLQNVRERLASLYGASASLVFFANEPHGVTAKLIVPLSVAAS